MKKILSILLLVLSLTPLISAIDYNQEISNEDKETFDDILSPVMKIYNFIKYSATVLAILFLVFVGVTFITSGNDRRKRESAKTMATYIVIGLIVIWISPLAVSYLVG